MSIAETFRTFCSNLYVSNPATISYRYNRIADRLNLDFYGYESKIYHRLYTGSYGRDTAIDGISDLDMIFWLPFQRYERYNNHETNGQSRMLQDVKESILLTYPSTKVGGDGQVVVVEFDDMVVEVQPAFENNDQSFTYPDSSLGGSWRNTHPRPEQGAISTLNTERNKNLKRLCRMMRAWKIRWNVPIKGLLIDTLAYRFMVGKPDYSQKSFLYYDFLSRDFFKFLSEQDGNQQYWLAPGSNQYVYRIGNFEYKAKQCYNIALEAIEHDNKHEYWSRNEKWRDIYGTKFPSN